MWQLVGPSNNTRGSPSTCPWGEARQEQGIQSRSTLAHRPRSHGLVRPVLGVRQGQRLRGDLATASGREGGGSRGARVPRPLGHQPRSGQPASGPLSPG